jgi:hypothetical protein
MTARAGNCGTGSIPWTCAPGRVRVWAAEVGRDPPVGESPPLRSRAASNRQGPPKPLSAWRLRFATLSHFPLLISPAADTSRLNPSPDCYPICYPPATRDAPRTGRSYRRLALPPRADPGRYPGDGTRERSAKEGSRPQPFPEESQEAEESQESSREKRAIERGFFAPSRARVQHDGTRTAGAGHPRPEIRGTGREGRAADEDRPAPDERPEPGGDREPG